MSWKVPPLNPHDWWRGGQAAATDQDHGRADAPPFPRSPPNPNACIRLSRCLRARPRSAAASKFSKKGGEPTETGRLRHTRRIVAAAAFLAAWCRLCSLSVLTGHEVSIVNPASMSPMPSVSEASARLFSRGQGPSAAWAGSALRDSFRESPSHVFARDPAFGLNT